MHRPLAQDTQDKLTFSPKSQATIAWSLLRKNLFHPWVRSPRVVLQWTDQLSIHQPNWLNTLNYIKQPIHVFKLYLQSQSDIVLHAKCHPISMLHHRRSTDWDNTQTLPATRGNYELSRTHLGCPAASDSALVTLRLASLSPCHLLHPSLTLLQIYHSVPPAKVVYIKLQMFDSLSRRAGVLR